MKEEYEKEEQNYNFWDEQAKMNNKGEIYNNRTEVEIQGYTQQEQPQQEALETTVYNEEKKVNKQETLEPYNIQKNETTSEYENQDAENVLNISSGQSENRNTNVSENGKKNKKNKKKNSAVKKKVIGLVASAALFGIVAGGVFEGVQYVGHKIFPNAIETNDSTINQNSKNKIATTTVSKKGAATGPTDVTDVVEKTMPSIVSITSKITTNYGYFGTQDSEGSGSGIIINKDDDELLIVTNNHVIDGASTISVKFIDDTVVDATVKGTDSTADLAVLSVNIKDIKEKTLNEISVIEMGSSDDVKVGEMAIAIGNALGYGQSVTVGYISAKDREVEVEDSQTMKLLQTDAAINPGNSGGALLDKDGKLIGINSAKYSDTSVEGMGYAIPISAATPIINDLMNREVLSEKEKGYLGVSIRVVSKEMSEAYNMPEGVYVSQVSEDGAAKESGIVVGDIITKIDDIETKTADALQEKVNSLRAGTKVTVTLMRYADGSYQEKKIEVTLKDKDTLNSLDSSSGTQSQDNSNNSQQSPNQGNSSENGQQVNPNTQDNQDESMQEFFNDYFGQ